MYKNRSDFLKKIVLTGGGTAGHTTPNIALIDKLKDDFSISYIGSIDGIERSLIEPLGIDYYKISTGKLRRYLDKKNIADAFKVVKGTFEATRIIRKLKPDVIFSKGGFVSVPVVIGGYLNKVPIIVHESDISIGLANKICIPFATKVCATFEEALNSIPKEKSVFSGTPMRDEIFEGNKSRAFKICSFTDKNKYTLLVMGGSLGSEKINKVLRKTLNSLLRTFNIIHLCGNKNLDSTLNNINGYYQVEYATGNLAHFLELSDIVVSRAGSNSICELLALRKPNLLIPLSKNTSRGDQILNANSFKNKGYSEVLFEEDLSDKTFIDNILTLVRNRSKYSDNMKRCSTINSTQIVLDEIHKLVH